MAGNGPRMRLRNWLEGFENIDDDDCDWLVDDVANLRIKCLD